MKLKRHLIAIASATLLASGLAAAQSTAPGAPMSPSANHPSTAAKPGAEPMPKRMAETNNEREQLQLKLRAAQTRADYAKILEANGYRIAAVNADKKDYLEYEVVKGEHSYEVQLDFDKGAALATQVEVAANLWRADATKRMLKDAKYKHAGMPKADPDSRYSDRRYMKSWTDEKDQLEKVLPPNLKVSAYKPKIESMGYKVTAVNEREKDHVEYEIAKGDNSYEVKIDVDPKTQIAKDVDVTSNLWEADATDKATSRKK